MLDKDTYCIKVCKGKCCTLHHESGAKVRCPKLSADCSCSIYEKRFAPNAPELEVVGFYQIKKGDGSWTINPFICWQITKLIAHKQLPKEVEDGCCYAHPELLEETNHNGTKAENS